MMDAITRALRPLHNRIVNSIARAVVQRIDDSEGMQSLQLGVLDGETVDDCEHMQGYGFTSAPLEGAEAIVLFPGGDRATPLVVAVDDRRHRISGLSPGEVAVYSSHGQVIKLLGNGTIEIGSQAGPYQQLATKSDIDALRSWCASHIHPATVGVTTPSTLPVPPAVGTTKLRAE